MGVGPCSHLLCNVVDVLHCWALFRVRVDANGYKFPQLLIKEINMFVSEKKTPLNKVDRLLAF